MHLCGVWRCCYIHFFFPLFFYFFIFLFKIIMTGLRMRVMNWEREAEGLTSSTSCGIAFSRPATYYFYPRLFVCVQCLPV